jgi:hypothetical protein
MEFTSKIKTEQTGKYHSLCVHKEEDSHWGGSDTGKSLIIIKIMEQPHTTSAEVAVSRTVFTRLK